MVGEQVAAMKFVRRNKGRRTSYGQTDPWSRLLVALIIAILIGGPLATWEWWDVLRSYGESESIGEGTGEGTGAGESVSATLQNVGFLMGGMIAICLALWRGRIATRQANTAFHHLQNERYQQGVKMLASDVLSVRSGGIFALEQLAEDEPRHFLTPVMKMLCEFVRNPPVTGGQAMTNIMDRDDTRAAMAAISNGNKLRHDLGIGMREKPDLHGIKLVGATIEGLDLSGINFQDAKMQGANIHDCTFRATDFTDAKLTGAIFSKKTDLHKAILRDAYLEGVIAHEAILNHATLVSATLTDAKLVSAEMREAKCNLAVWFDADITGSDVSGASFGTQDSHIVTITQEQLDSADADKDVPPEVPPYYKYEGTKSPLTWRDTTTPD